MTPRSAGFPLLAAAVRRRCPTPRSVRDFGVSTGLGHRLIVDALEARLDDADDVMRLCLALGLDPVTMRDAAPGFAPFGGATLWIVFGAALTVARHLRAQDQRTAAREARVSLATFSRAENGQRLSARPYFRLCAYAGRHPHFFTAGPAQRDALTALGAAIASDEPGGRAAMERIAAAKAELAKLNCFTGDSA